MPTRFMISFQIKRQSQEEEESENKTANKSENDLNGSKITMTLSWAIMPVTSATYPSVYGR